MASAAYNGGPGQGAKPPEAESFLVSARPKEMHN